MQANSFWVKDQYFLSNLLHLSLVTPTSNESIAANINYTLSYNISFDPDINVMMEEADGSSIQMGLNQAMIWVQGNIINLFSDTLLAMDQNLLLRNYFTKIYPAL